MSRSESTPRLTVAVPTFGREEVLVRTLELALAHLRAGEMELLVIDQTPVHEEGVEAQVGAWETAGLLRRVRLEPPSLTRARNVGLREAAGEIVLFLDDDILIPGHLFRQHLDAYRHEEIGAVTGQVFNCIDPACPPSLSDPRKGTRPHSTVEHVCPARNVSGGNHSVRRRIALAVGGYDEAFIASALAEDLDFSQRLLMAGQRILYDPTAWIIHLGVGSGGCGVSGESTWPEWSHSANLWLYAFRHGFRQRNFGRFLWMAFRHGPGRKEIATRPWRWPGAWCGFLRGMGYGFRHRHISPPGALSS